jgi:type VI secretion system protein ImpH
VPLAGAGGRKGAVVSASVGRKTAALSQRLLDEARCFDFFQAVRLLERLARERAADGARSGDRATTKAWRPVGQDWPEREAVRFRALAALSFPTSAIREIRPATGPDADERPLEMFVTFLGLTGPSGVLPQHYTALLSERIRHKDFALRDFLDLFHHRLLSLFYRAWLKYRLPFTYEQSRLDAAAEDSDPCTWSLYCLVGLGSASLRHRLAVDDEAFLYYGGHFAHHPRSADSLERLLVDYFGLAVRLQQFHGQWLHLGEDDCSQFPGPQCPQGRNFQLGVLVVGRRVWDLQSKFRLRLGPLTYEQFRGFMPDGDAFRRLCELTRSYVGLEFDYDVQPVLKRAEVPACRLETHGPERRRLGWDTWVRHGEPERDAEDVVFACPASEGDKVTR